MQRAMLEVVQGQRLGNRFPVGSRIVIGRDVGCDLQLFDEGLSRRHLLIESDSRGFRLEDLGSSNGSYVNGRRITQARLVHGDVITAGTTQLQFQVETDSRIGSGISTRSAPRTTDLVELVADPAGHTGAQIKKRVDVSSLRWMEPGAEAQAANQQASRALSVLYRVGNLVNAESNFDALCAALVDAILEVVNCDRACLILLDAATKQMETVAASTRRMTPVGTSKVSLTIVEDCVKRGMSVLSADAMADKRFRAGDSVMMQNIRSVMCVPVETNSRVLGAIYVDNLAASGMFSEFDLDLVSAIGKQAGVAIERAQLVEDMQQLFYNTIRTLVATLEAKDTYTHGHSERVTSYAVQIAQEMGLDYATVDTIHLAGLLHDIGKVGISEKILNKPGPLTDEEFAAIKAHPVIGADIVRNINGTEQVVEIVRHHHERFDGKGYPDGLAGEAISLPTRILTVADSYDAMTSNRAYRRNFTTPEIVAEIERCAGVQFDPDVARVFITILSENRLATIREVYERGLDSQFSHYFKRFRERSTSSGLHRALRETRRRRSIDAPTRRDDDTERTRMHKAVDLDATVPQVPTVGTAPAVAGALDATVVPDAPPEE